jgi:hypothetical protein
MHERELVPDQSKYASVTGHLLASQQILLMLAYLMVVFGEEGIQP